MTNVIRKTIRPELRLSNSWIETKLTFAKLECGHLAFVVSGEHSPEKVLPEYPCESCGDIEAHKTQIAEWQRTKHITHTRAVYNHSSDTYSVRVYGKEDNSPTGVILLGGLPDIPELQYFLKGSLAPLSPTER